MSRNLSRFVAGLDEELDKIIDLVGTKADAEAVAEWLGQTLSKSANLSDLADKAVGRINLGLGAAATKNDQIAAIVHPSDVIANTALETVFASKHTIPANKLAVGSIIRLKIWGMYGTALIAPLITGRIKLGGQTLLNTGQITSVAGLVNSGWSADAYFVVKTVGANGVIEAQGFAQFATALTTGLSVNVMNAASYNINTTVPLELSVTAHFSAAHASNKIQLKIMTVEVLNI